MSDEPEIGTAEWWRETPCDGARGTTDTILRLLEQGEISRAKACELVTYCYEVSYAAEHGYALAPAPPAPWDRLNWCDGDDMCEEFAPGKRRIGATCEGAGPRFAETWCSQCGQGFGPGDHGFSHCENHAGLPVVEP